MSQPYIPSKYADLEIRIREAQADGYPIELTVNHEQEYQGGHLDPSFLPWKPGASPKEDGRRLFDWLFASDAFKETWAEIRGQYGQRRIRLRLDESVPELHAIPWETLRDESSSFGHDLAASEATPFSRYLAGKWQPGSPILKRPIKILVAIANPSDLPSYNLAPIEVGAEWEALQTTLQGLEAELTQLPQPCTLSALETELKQGYHILHFIGHGQFSQRQQQAQLYLATDQGEVDLITAERFADMLSRQLSQGEQQTDNRLRLIFLASCQTASRSPADAFRGFAPTLVTAGVPAVLAMQDLVPIKTAQTFSQVFYRQLLVHGQIDLASNEARSSLLTENLPGAATPVLFMRLRSGMLLGQRGRIISSQADTFWPFLLQNISYGKCLPILGPRINEGLLPDANLAAEKLATKYDYPYKSPDRQRLTQVAQFVGLKDRSLLQDDYLRLMKQSLPRYLGLTLTDEERKQYGRASFSETVAGIGWAKKVFESQENQIHHRLAEMEFPLYLTTNFDNFMEEALRYQNLNPSHAGPRWRQQGDQVQYVLPEPTAEKPLVFHLNGYDGDERLILSEDDYLAHLVSLARDQDHLLPMNIIRALSQQSFMLLGFSLDDWEFRVILQGILRSIAQTGVKRHIGVQLEIDATENIKNVEAYLQEYLGQFKVDIYWGTVTQFVNELYTYWQESQASDEDDDDGWDDDW